NARYSHASLGLRWLKANLGELEPRAEILEFVTGARTELLAQRILARQPRIVGLGVYIWNVEETTRLAAMLRVLAPDLVLVGGGPELSYEFESQRLFGVLDHLVTGPGELAFAGLCRQALGTADAASAAADDESRALAPAAAAPLPKVIAG